MVKNLPANAEDLLEKKMATHSSILAGKSQGQRSLVDYSPRSCKKSDTTEHAHADTERFHSNLGFL